ncbi:MAG: 16S rRNA (cytosine(1402)-N(4))-methyltransferase RsmH [Phycisphaeraceae bacterium]
MDTDPIDEPVSADAPSTGHYPVLVEEVLRLLDPKPGQVMLDCTVGRGGHAAAIIPKLIPGGTFIGLDTDPANAAYAKERLTGAAPSAQEQSHGSPRQASATRGTLAPCAQAPCAVHIFHANFAAARTALDAVGVKRVDLLLADFGFASNQVNDPARGFSFMNDGPLDMRLDTTQPTTAAHLVNSLPEKELADLIYQYGEERLSRRIARKIVEVRRLSPINSTGTLAEVVRQACGVASFKRSSRAGQAHHTGGRPGKTGRIDPATRTFMALRIAVNGELEAIEQLLGDLPSLLNPGGTAALIAFHSLEDRPVKRALVELEKTGRARRLTPRPMVASDDEIARNPRSRSAKLRAVRFDVKSAT